MGEYNRRRRRASRKGSARKPPRETPSLKAIKAELARLPPPRTTRQEKKRVELEKRLRQSARRAGFSETSIAAQVGWARRRAREWHPEPTRGQKAAITRFRSKLASLKLDTSKNAKHARAVAEKGLREVLARLGLSKKQIAAHVGAATKTRRTAYGRLRKAREKALGAPAIDVRDRDVHRMLLAHVTRGREQSRALDEFLDAADDEGMDYDTAIDLWFSPEAE